MLAKPKILQNQTIRRKALTLYTPLYFSFEYRLALTFEFKKTENPKFYFHNTQRIYVCKNRVTRPYMKKVRRQYSFKKFMNCPQIPYFNVH